MYSLDQRSALARQDPRYTAWLAADGQAALATLNSIYGSPWRGRRSYALKNIPRAGDQRQATPRPAVQLIEIGLFARGPSADAVLTSLGVHAVADYERLARAL